LRLAALAGGRGRHRNQEEAFMPDIAMLEAALNDCQNECATIGSERRTLLAETDPF